MKKQLLAVCLMILAGWQAKAQVTLGNVNTQFYQADIGTLIEAHLDVINNSSSTIDINVDRFIDVQNPNHTESFCFGLYCYLPGTPSSASPTTVAANTTEQTFKAQIDPLGYDGYDRIHYRFYDANNIADSVGLTMEFFFGTSGIDENAGKSYLKFKNEVNSFTILNYRLPLNAKEAKINVHNLLGSLMTSIKINDVQGMQVLDASTMANGMYLVSLTADGKTIHSYRMVVNHNK